MDIAGRKPDKQWLDQRHRDGRPRRPPQAPAQRALRRPAAARRRGPRAGLPARDHLRRRADRQPRLALRRRGAGLPAQLRTGAGPDRRDGHPRPGGRLLRGPRRSSSPTAGSSTRCTARPPTAVLDRMKRFDAKGRTSCRPYEHSPAGPPPTSSRRAPPASPAATGATRQDSPCSVPPCATSRAQGPAADDRARRACSASPSSPAPWSSPTPSPTPSRRAPPRASTTSIVAIQPADGSGRRARRGVGQDARARRQATLDKARELPGADVAPPAPSPASPRSPTRTASWSATAGQSSGANYYPGQGRQGRPLPDERGPRPRSAPTRSPWTPRPPSAPATRSATPSGCPIDGPVTKQTRHRHLHHRRRQRRRGRQPRPLRHRHRAEALRASPGSTTRSRQGRGRAPPRPQLKTAVEKILPEGQAEATTGKQLADDQAETIDEEHERHADRPAGLRRHRAVRRHLHHRQHLHHAGRPAHQGAGAAARGRRHAAARSPARC